MCDSRTRVTRPTHFSFCASRPALGSLSGSSWFYTYLYIPAHRIFYCFIIISPSFVNLGSTIEREQQSEWRRVRHMVFSLARVLRVPGVTCRYELRCLKEQY